MRCVIFQLVLCVMCMHAQYASESRWTRLRTRFCGWRDVEFARQCQSYRRCALCGSCAGWRLTGCCCCCCSCCLRLPEDRNGNLNWKQSFEYSHCPPFAVSHDVVFFVFPTKKPIRVLVFPKTFIGFPEKNTWLVFPKKTTFIWFFRKKKPFVWFSQKRSSGRNLNLKTFAMSCSLFSRKTKKANVCNGKLKLKTFIDFVFLSPCGAIKLFVSSEKKNRLEWNFEIENVHWFCCHCPHAPQSSHPFPPKIKKKQHFRKE